VGKDTVKGDATLYSSQSSMEEPTLRLEVPFDEHDAKRRAIDPSLCKIIYECQTTDNNICVAQLATAIDRCCSVNGGAYITAVGEFVPIETLQSINGSKIIGTHHLINAESKDALEKILACWDAEALVIFFSDIDAAKTITSNVERLQKEWWRYRKGAYDRDFLSQIELCGLLIFYSSTHQSLEIIGHEEQIKKCHECLRMLN